jgi:hypothetical protein
MSDAAPARSGDDRILPATRWTSLAFAVILVAAVIILWGTPGETAERWAWTIRPDLTPIFMGSVYAAGSYAFFRLFFSPAWHPFSAVLIGAVALTTLILVSTLVHYDKFNHGDGPLPADIAFYGWVAIYALAPAWIAGLWLINRRADPGDGGTGPRVPRGVRRASAVLGAAGAIVASLFMLWPDGVADVWPWELTPLTARVLGSYVATIAVLGLVLSRDGRWSSWRVVVQTLLVFLCFLLVGAARAFDDFDQDNALTWAYLGGAALGALGLALFYRSMETARR